MKRIIAVMFLAALPVFGLAGHAEAQQVGKVSKGKLASACKVAGGTTYTGANGRYGCIVEHDDGWSDSITCTKNLGCFAERWPPVTIKVASKPIMVTPVTGPIGAVLGR